MSIALQLLTRLGGYREEASPDGTPSGGGSEAVPDKVPGKGDFNPTEIQQGTGLHDKAKDLQKQQEEDGGPEKEATAEVDPKKEETGQEVTDQSPLTYNGVEVTVTNDPEVVRMFEEAKDKLGGVTVDAVNKELFSEKGLTEPTKQKLYDAFGKPAVDMYLKGWKANNDAALAQVEVLSAQYSDMAEKATGGKLTEVLKWANDNLKPAEYLDYADMVNSGDLKVARMALADMHRRSGMGAPSASGPASKARETGMKPTNLAPDGSESGPISAQEYHTAITSREYYKDPKSWDARRRAGQAQGI